ncbi:hypothetical protein SELMODRAFT_405303 [Selaginella moellendorffii]|uniref:Uncharacterized protein n=1 Tax=Selaginella moellendorffii TaxID=88036 RepID=D8QWX5_SELML|nr:hypothetical protein SELMODRAFT_405303 [Selaginella moellendorffii]
MNGNWHSHTTDESHSTFFQISLGTEMLPLRANVMKAFVLSAYWRVLLPWRRRTWPWPLMERFGIYIMCSWMGREYILSMQIPRVLVKTLASCYCSLRDQTHVFWGACYHREVIDVQGRRCPWNFAGTFFLHESGFCLNGRKATDGPWKKVDILVPMPINERLSVRGNMVVFSCARGTKSRFKQMQMRTGET